jgi:hypothetical protein
MSRGEGAAGRDIYNIQAMDDATIVAVAIVETPLPEKVSNFDFNRAEAPVAANKELAYRSRR